MDFRILGALEVDLGGAVELGSPKQRALLAALLVRANELVPVDRLVDMVWGETPPRTAAHSVQIYVSELRRAFAPESGRLVTRPPGYLLRAAPDEVDAGRFEAALGLAADLRAGGDVRAATGTLADALALWRGPVLADVADAEFARAEATRLEDLREGAVDDWAEGVITTGAAPRAVPALEAALAANPLRERTAGLLMRALYLSGRQADALAVYRRQRRVLAVDLGLDPSPELARLQEQILLHDMPMPRAANGLAPANPYKGLRPFDEDDADIFFGRDEAIRDLTSRLESGSRLVSVIGHSGSGKSSLVRAGLVPALTTGTRRWQTAVITPGSRPGLELDHILEGWGEDTSHSLLVVDQAEELWSVTDAAEREAFLAHLVDLVTRDGGASAVLTLRADFFGRPLEHPTLAPLFRDSVITILPLAARDLEAAIIRPAERVGVTVEPALLAQLAAEMARRPGALPLLQYALTEVFELRAGDTLTLATYQRIGGMSGAVAGRAEHVFGALTEERRAVAEHMLLRLVVPDPDGESPRLARVRVADLVDLDFDPVDLSTVIEAFVAQRLLTVDRTAVDGAATVEIAHEALLREWPRLADAVAAHRDDLVRLAQLSAAARSWQDQGSDTAYLARGDQLAALQAFAASTDLKLKPAEHTYIERSRAAHAATLAEESAGREREHKLVRRARNRTIALVAVLAAAAVGLYLGFATPGEREFVLLTQGEGDAIVRQINNAFLEVMREQGSDGQIIEVTWDEKGRMSHLDEAGALHAMPSEERRTMILGLSGDWCGVPDGPDAVAIWTSMRWCPERRISSVAFASHEAAFLAGAAAALTTSTERVGFLGGPNCALIRSFEAGFRAGVHAADPAVEVDVRYLEDCDFLAFGAEYQDDARARGAELYNGGADVVFTAAGEAGLGATQAAEELSEPDRHLWVIGVDEDQEAALRSAAITEAEKVSRAAHILTSVVFGPEALIRTVTAVSDPKDRVRYVYLGIADEGAVSLKPLDKFGSADRDALDDLTARVASGDLGVPTVLADDDGRVATELDGGLGFAVPDGWVIVEDLPGMVVASPTRDGDATVWIPRDVLGPIDGDSSLAGPNTPASELVQQVKEAAAVTEGPHRVDVGGAAGYMVKVTCAAEPCEPVLSWGPAAEGYGPLDYLPLVGTTDTLFLVEHPDGGTLGIVVRDEDGEDAAQFEADAEQLVESMTFGD
ncbi:BTAD domain-containing putative transcriptional regulator [Georgenia yuyongxinii]|nr:BTAD domain-containing putative transcriptional regulator [Georgenia yuyongxinii]